MEWPPAPGDLDWYFAVDLVSDFVNDKCNTGYQNLKNVIDTAALDGWLERKYYADGYSSSGRLTDIDVGFYGYEQVSSEMMTRLLAWLWLIGQRDAVDYYWSFEDYKKPRVLSSLRHDDYEPDLDMDEEDFRTMKEGHALVSRLLMRVRDWPQFSDKAHDNEQRKRFMIRTCLSKMSVVLKYMITKGKEWSSSRLTDAEMEVAFAAGVTSASTPRAMKRKFDNLDTMVVSPIELADKPREAKRLCLRKRKLPVRRKLDFGEKSFVAQPLTDKKEILKLKGITPKKAKQLLDYAYSGNQLCYAEVEKETGVDMGFLADYAASSPESPLSSGYSDFVDTPSRPDNTLNSGSEYENEIGGNPLTVFIPDESKSEVVMLGENSDNPIVIE